MQIDPARALEKLSPGLVAKALHVAKARGHLPRLLTPAEAAEIRTLGVVDADVTRGWLMFGHAQLVVRRRDNGRWVIFRLGGGLAGGQKRTAETLLRELEARRRLEAVAR